MKSITARTNLLILFIMLVAISAMAQQPAATPQEDSITGRVVNDGGQPVAGVSVGISAMGGSSGGSRTSTDSEGNFKIQGLDAGIYRIFISAPGYVTQMPISPSPTYRPGDKAELTLIKGGVVAGNVTNINGDPVVNITVRAYQLRDVEGNKVAVPYFSQVKFTDDRGYYRIYGLQPGTYLIAAGGTGQYFGSANPYANDALTYAPASTRDTAAEIVVRSNQEVNVDIRYRAEPGHAVSGKLSGASPAPPFGASVRLTDPDSHISIASTPVMNADKSFQMNGVSDGEYEIIASAGGGPTTDVLSSVPRRISVRGTDVTGLDLALSPMASIEARVNLEPDQKLNCGRRRDTALRETMITLRRARVEEKSAAKDKSLETSETFASPAMPYEAAPNDKGEIRFRNLFAASYRFEVRLPAFGWYLKSLSLPKPDVNIARNGIVVKQGEKVSGVAITVAEGGASLRGHVRTQPEQTLPPNLRIYLAPAEPENADNPLRFFEDGVAGDGAFAIGNIAPGQYWLITQPTERIDPNTIKSPRTENDLRAKILKAAAALKNEITFTPCDRTVDYEFHYPAAKP